MPGYSEEDVKALFGQHKMGPKTFDRFSGIKAKFEDLTLWVRENVPGCPMQTTTINKLFEAKNCATMGFLTEAVKAGSNED